MAAKIIHVEVAGKDGPALQRFYSDVFGWELNTDNPGGYGLVRQGDVTGGIGGRTAGRPRPFTSTPHPAGDPRVRGRVVA